MSTSIKIPPNVEVETFHHAVTGSGESSEEKGASVTAIILRSLSRTTSGAAESLKIRVPGENSMRTLTLDFPSNGGQPICYQKDETLSPYAQGLLLEQGRRQEGFVVRAADLLDPTVGATYTAFTRPK